MKRTFIHITCLNPLYFILILLFVHIMAIVKTICGNLNDLAITLDEIQPDNRHSDGPTDSGGSVINTPAQP